MQRRVSPVLALSAAVALLIPLSAASADDEGDRIHPRKTPAPAAPAIAPADATALELPPVPHEWAVAATSLTKEYDGNPDFGGVSVDPQRTTLEVEWFGAATAGLTADLAQLDSQGIPASIDPLPVSPGELRDAARAMLGTVVDGVEVTGAGPSPQGDSIDVTVDTVRETGHLPPLDSLEPKFSGRAGHEVRVVGEGHNEPTTRLADDAHIAGARVRVVLSDGRIGNGQCTSAFAVHNGSRRGLMHAAHCGAEGPQRWAHRSADGKYYLYGTTIARQWAHDAAIIESNFSQPYVYIGTYDNANGSATAIHGTVVPFEGGEICYEGSFSGQSCGNVVESADWAYRIKNNADQVISVTGVRTRNINGRPAVGNGDSGGPGIMIVGSAGNYRAMAAVIISAMSTTDWGPTCQGVSGDPLPPPDGRWCSPTAMAPPVWRIEQDMGWTVTSYTAP